MTLKSYYGSNLPGIFDKELKTALDLVLNKWFKDFFKSEYANVLNKEDKEYALAILQDFTYYLLYYQDCHPDNWNINTIKPCLIRDYPRSL